MVLKISQNFLRIDRKISVSSDCRSSKFKSFYASPLRWLYEDGQCQKMFQRDVCSYHFD